MRFGIIFQHQLPRPWEPHSEQKLLTNALEQIELADGCGIDYAWVVEHHFLEEYSHSSAPEVFLAAASQRTKNIRLGHGIIQAPSPINHPVRTAERIATLDLISGGRVDFGTGESNSPAELGGFGVARNTKRLMWEEALDAVTRMFVEEPFTGYDGRFIRVPPRNVIPKPLQKPHPPLWMACSHRDTIHLAARSGLGALSFSFSEPENAARWVREYYELVESDECVPKGFAVNPNVAVVVPMMLHKNEMTAIERGIDGAQFFGYSLLHFYGKQHIVGHTDLWKSFQADRSDQGLGRDALSMDRAPLAARLLESGMGSLRGAIGTPSQAIDLLMRYEAAGVDQVMFVMQVGKTAHEHVCESIELFASAVLPKFREGRERVEAAKADRLASVIERALARRSGPRKLATPYVIVESKEKESAANVGITSRPGNLHEVATAAAVIVASSAGKRIRSNVRSLLGWLPRRHIHRLLSNSGVQYVIFYILVSRLDRARAVGFSGTIDCRLDLDDGTVRVWTIEITEARARLRKRAATNPQLSISISLANLISLGFGSVSSKELIASGDLTIDGDLEWAVKLIGLFGGRPVLRTV